MTVRALSVAAGRGGPASVATGDSTWAHATRSWHIRDSRTISNSRRCSRATSAVDDDDDGVVVSAVSPQRLIGIAENDDLDSVGDDAYERFGRVLESL